MNAQTVCRICKTEGVRLHCITNTHLQQMYERETHALLTTDDNKPILACIECCDRLQQCYQSRNGTEQRENTPTIMYPQLQIGQNEPNTNIIGITVEVQKDNTCVVQSDVEKCVKMEPEQLSDVEVKQESTSDIEDGTLLDNNIKLEENNQKSVTGHNSAPRIIKVETMNVYQNEQEEIKENEVNRAPKSETPENISSKQKKNDETLNNTEETSNEKEKLAQLTLIHTSENPVQCDLCKKCFKHKMSLAKHACTYTRKKCFQCDVCKKYISTRSSLEVHIRTHTGEKPFECNVCKRRFRVKGNLARHTFTHTDKKPFECEHCKKGFIMKCDLIIHARVHTGVNPFECDVCKKRFRRKKNLTQHTLTHTSQKTFQCGTCKNFFKNKCSLAKHARIQCREKSYECDTCRKCFPSKLCLLNHAFIHTFEKRIQCDICKIFFSTSAAECTRLHTDEKPFKCDACMKRYRNTYSRVTKHTRTHTECHVSDTVTK